MSEIIEIYKVAAAREQFELNYIRETYRDFLRSNLLGLAGIVALIGYSGANIENSAFRSSISVLVVVLLSLVGIYINVQFARHFENLLNSFNAWLVSLKEIESSGDYLKHFKYNNIEVYKRMKDHIGDSVEPKQDRIFQWLRLEYQTKQSDGSSGRFYINQAKVFICIYAMILLLDIAAIIWAIYQYPLWKTGLEIWT